MNGKAPWKQVTARVPRCCTGFTRVNSCGRRIAVGDKFFQCQWRDGLDRAEICQDCAKLSGVKND